MRVRSCSPPLATSSRPRMAMSMRRARRNTRCSPCCWRERRMQPHSAASPSFAAMRRRLVARTWRWRKPRTMRAPRKIEREFFDLFIGIGRGELLPYGSYYLTGFLQRAAAGAIARRSARARHRTRRRTGGAGRSRRHPLRDHGRAGRRTASPATPGCSSSFSKNISPPGSDASSPIWNAPKRPISTAMSGTVGRLFMEIETEAFALPA